MPLVITRLKFERKFAVLMIWKIDQAVANACVANDAKMWGMDSFRSATMDMPNTH